MDVWKLGLVALQAAPTYVTVAGAQWLCLLPHRWETKALLRANLYHLLINNQRSAIIIKNK
jgi:hypothetical protein